MDLLLLAAMGKEEFYIMLVAGALGTSLIVAGWLTRSALARGWAEYNSSEEQPDYKFHERRFRRRTSVSWLMMIIGSMIILGGIVILPLIPVEKLSSLAAVYLCVTLAPAMWMILLAMADMLTSVAHARAEMSRIGSERRDVEDMLADYKRHKTNGEVKK